MNERVTINTADYETDDANSAKLKLDKLGSLLSTTTTTRKLSLEVVSTTLATF